MSTENTLSVADLAVKMSATWYRISPPPSGR
ncbi:Uncharacterised protein [Salmonella enterica subsp. enterica]|uniref:Uncharacterized protein n=1 Tax=Salmonella enterica I TaxID=59201 RepID=A0A379US74_SALET|nr:Uncharacterised protein [Salmonella enterica subsp. enterica]